MSTSPTWIIDPGHGWLAVPYDDAARAASTGYGYLDAASGTAYLEEDCEAGEWLSRHPEIDPRTIPVTRFELDAPLRFLPRLPGGAA
jgi:hypothetical protein